MREEWSGFIIGIFVGIFLGSIIGGCIEKCIWESQLRSGKGPQITEALKLEAKAAELRKEAWR